MDGLNLNDIQDLLSSDEDDLLSSLRASAEQRMARASDAEVKQVSDLLEKMKKLQAEIEASIRRYYRDKADACAWADSVVANDADDSDDGESVTDDMSDVGDEPHQRGTPNSDSPRSTQ